MNWNEANIAINEGRKVFSFILPEGDYLHLDNNGQVVHKDGLEYSLEYDLFEDFGWFVFGKPFVMNKREAYMAMEYGHKITHQYFTDDEFLMCDEKSGSIVTEEGYNYDDVWNNDNAPWRQNGWIIYNKQN